MVIFLSVKYYYKDRIRNDGIGGVCSMHLRYDKYNIYNGKLKEKEKCDSGVHVRY